MSKTQAGIEALPNYDWPGNIRELCNVIQRAAIFAQGGALDFDLPMGNPPAEPTSPSPAIGDDVNGGYLTEAEMSRCERENLSIVLQKTGIDAALPQLLATAPRSKDRLDFAWVAQSQRSTEAIAFSL